MTPLQLARSYCANHDYGRCLGIGIHDDGRLFGFGSKPKCSITVSRCAYFEECVVPMDRSLIGLPQAQPILQAIDTYRKQFGSAKSESDLCANCHRPRAKGRRLCAYCAHEAKKAAKKNRHE